MMGERRQSIFKNRAPTAPFTLLPNALIRDRRLKPDALGFLARVLMLPKDWEFNVAWAMRENGIGRDQIYRLVNALIATGYCRRREQVRSSGRWEKVVYEFTDEVGSFPGDQPPLPEIPDTVSPEPELPDAVTPRAVKPETRQKKYRATKKDSPPTPDGELRESGFERVLQELRTAYPPCLNAIDHLVDPLLRQRKLHGCPDPVFALGEIVKKASSLEPAVLAGIVERIKAMRAFSFKVADVDAALKNTLAMAAAPLHSTHLEPATEATGRLREALRRELGQGIFDAWFAAIEVEAIEAAAVSVTVSNEFISRYITQHFEPVLTASVAAVFGVAAVRIAVRRSGKVEA